MFMVCRLVTACILLHHIFSLFPAKFLNACPFDYTAFVVSGKAGHPLTGLTTPAGLAIDTPTDHPKSVRNRCVINVLVAFLCC